MTITVLGPGCKRCAALEAATRQAAGELGLDAEVVKVTDYAEMARMGVMSTPALAVDGRVLVAGQVPSVEQLKNVLSGAAG